MLKQGVALLLVGKLNAFGVVVGKSSGGQSVGHEVQIN